MAPVCTVVVPTLAADDALRACVDSLERQAFAGEFDIVVVDNSGAGKVRSLGLGSPRLRIIENTANAGFGGAINQGWRASDAPFIATLNDDAAAEPGWLGALVDAMRDPRAGMAASQVRLSGDTLDSAGMLVCGDGSSKQRGHGEAPATYDAAHEALLPSGSAALYRRTMLDQTGGFDESFFLYCEDTDLGLRALRRGWRCVYEPRAVVHHRYSHSAGRASALKAYYVERNRLRVLLKNFPAGMLWRAPFVSAARYGWHLVAMLQGRGAASSFRQGGSGWMLPLLVARAHASVLMDLPDLLSQRREIQRSAAVDTAEFIQMLRRHWITARQVALQ